MSVVLGRLEALLAGHGVPYRRIEHAPAASAEEYHRIVGSRLEQQAKALFVRYKKLSKKGYVIV